MNLSEILAMQYEPNKKKTLIYGMNHQKEYRKEKPMELLSLACLKNGSSLQGRIEAICHSMGYKQKPPIYIGGLDGLFAISDRSYKDNLECIWLMENRIFSLIQEEPSLTKVLFHSGDVLQLPVNKVILQRQMNRCDAYRKFLQQHGNFL